MAQDYAALIQGAKPEGPYRLMGWSMGGIIAHAVAAVASMMEQRSMR